jgi:hypothetical protein
MENSCIIFNNVKRLKDRIIMICCVYDSRYYRVLTIACRDNQSEDGATQIIFWKNLKFVMSKNGVPNVNFKGIMVDSAQTNCNAVKTIYSDGDPKSIYGCT